MNKHIKIVLEIIESDLAEVPSLESISQKLGISRYFLSRKFKESTGESFSEYVKRRKGAEAAKSMQLTNRRILDIAIDYGYSSQESFHRSFKSLFKETPKLAQFHHSMLFKRSAIELKPSLDIEWEKKSIGPVKLKALGKKFSYNEFDEIEKFWKDFNEKHPEIKGDTYGLSLPLIENDEPESFYYLIAFDHSYEVHGAITIEIPKTEYIVFTHVGQSSELLNTFNYIWGKWLYENKEITVKGMDFEYYPEEYDPMNSSGRCYVFLPIVYS